MQIIIDTRDLTRDDASAVLAAIFAIYPDLGGPDVVPTLRLSPAAEAFGSTGTDPVPSPAEAFASPPAAAAGVLAADGFSTNAPSAPAAAAQPPTPAPGPSSTDVYDNTGCPWDARIHATAEGGGGTLTDKGVWRKKRFVKDADTLAVQTELRAAGRWGSNIPPAPAPAAAPPPPPAPIAPPPSDMSASVTPASPPSPVPAASSPPPPSGAEPTDFPSFMLFVSEHQRSGALSPEIVTETLKMFGMAALPDVFANTGHIPALVATLKSRM